MSRNTPDNLPRRVVLMTALGGAGALLLQPFSGVEGALAAATGSLGTGDDEKAANKRAQAWMTGLALPAGAVSVPSNPSPTLSIQQTEWWPKPMVVSTGYWTLAGSTVASATNWLTSHPTLDLIVPTQDILLEEDDIDMATVANVPHRDALEGIAYTVAKTSDGVAIRAEIGAMPGSATRPTLAHGAFPGGPGQG